MSLAVPMAIVIPLTQSRPRLFYSILLPIPTSRTKGVLVCKTAFGNIIVGPTAEDQKIEKIEIQYQKHYYNYKRKVKKYYQP